MSEVIRDARKVTFTLDFWHLKGVKVTKFYPT